MNSKDGPYSFIVHRSSLLMKYGLIAGNGSFPFYVLDGARQRGVEMVVAAIKEETDPTIEQHADRVEWVGVGQLGKLIGCFKREQITHVIMAGQVKHHQIFRLNALPDLRMVKLLARLPKRNTDSLIAAIADELGREGIALVSSTVFLDHMLAKEGVLTRRPPNSDEQADLEFGYGVADSIAGLDIGQTIAVKSAAVVAVEAMEGTDAVIARAGQLAGSGVRVIKVAKPKQDMRFDVPVVGVSTIEAMRATGATLLSVDAGKTLMIDGDAIFQAADDAGIAIVGRPQR